MKYYIRRTNRETGKVWKAFCEEKNGEYILKAGSIISDKELLRCPKKNTNNEKFRTDKFRQEIVERHKI